MYQMLFLMTLWVSHHCLMASLPGDRAEQALASMRTATGGHASPVGSTMARRDVQEAGAVGGVFLPESFPTEARALPASAAKAPFIPPFAQSQIQILQRFFKTQPLGGSWTATSQKQIGIILNRLCTEDLFKPATPPVFLGQDAFVEQCVKDWVGIIMSYRYLVDAHGKSKGSLQDVGGGKKQMGMDMQQVWYETKESQIALMSLNRAMFDIFHKRFELNPGLPYAIDPSLYAGRFSVRMNDATLHHVHYTQADGSYDVVLLNLSQPHHLKMTTSYWASPADPEGLGLRAFFVRADGEDRLIYEEPALVYALAGSGPENMSLRCRMYTGASGYMGLEPFRLAERFFSESVTEAQIQEHPTLSKMWQDLTENGPHPVHKSAIHIVPLYFNFPADEAAANIVLLENMIKIAEEGTGEDKVGAQASLEWIEENAKKPVATIIKVLERKIEEQLRLEEKAKIEAEYNARVLAEQKVRAAFVESGGLNKKPVGTGKKARKKLAKAAKEKTKAAQNQKASAEALSTEKKSKLAQIGKRVKAMRQALVGKTRLKYRHLISAMSGLAAVAGTEKLNAITKGSHTVLHLQGMEPVTFVRPHGHTAGEVYADTAIQVVTDLGQALRKQVIADMNQTLSA